MKVAVLGCGPAGLLAAHASARAGATVSIYSDQKVPSRIGGAQFLHRAIPDVTADEPDDMCNFRHMGYPRYYAQKVYGDPDADTSWGAYHEGLHPIWNLQQAYDKLWDLYNYYIFPMVVEAGNLRLMAEAYDVVFSCIPKPALCNHEPRCAFVKQDVWIVNADNHFENLDCAIVYNGYPRTPWYRWSHLFGHAFFEYAEPRPNSRKISKPLRTTCPGPEHLTNVIGLGRYGAWEKHQLVHHAYEGAENALHVVQ